MEKHQQSTDCPDSDKLNWLANQIFMAFPKKITSLKFYTLDCGCIHYQRIFRDGNLDSQTGIYRDSEDGPCDACMSLEESWKDRKIDEVVVYNSKFEID